jgi:hypothetical protein
MHNEKDLRAKEIRTYAICVALHDLNVVQNILQVNLEKKYKIKYTCSTSID